MSRHGSISGSRGWAKGRGRTGLWVVHREKEDCQAVPRRLTVGKDRLSAKPRRSQSSETAG